MSTEAGTVSILSKFSLQQSFSVVWRKTHSRLVNCISVKARLYYCRNQSWAPEKKGPNEYGLTQANHSILKAIPLCPSRKFYQKIFSSKTFNITKEVNPLFCFAQCCIDCFTVHWKTSKWLTFIIIDCIVYAYGLFSCNVQIPHTRILFKITFIE